MRKCGSIAILRLPILDNLPGLEFIFIIYISKEREKIIVTLIFNTAPNTFSSVRLFYLVLVERLLLVFIKMHVITMGGDM